MARFFISEIIIDYKVKKGKILNAHVKKINVAIFIVDVIRYKNIVQNHVNATKLNVIICLIQVPNFNNYDDILINKFYLYSKNVEIRLFYYNQVVLVLLLALDFYLTA